MIAANDDNNKMKKCAACGESGDGLKTCTACKLVKYCSVACQKAHRPQHKKECKKLAAELFDEALFEQPPPRKECPICCLPMPIQTASSTRKTYEECCGKEICNGCFCAVVNVGRYCCPFCRNPGDLSDEEANKRLKKRVEDGDANAIDHLANGYYGGQWGFPQDYGKAIELWIRAGELGCADAYYSAGAMYVKGEGVERDEKIGKHYYELAAMGGDVMARYNLGSIEYDLGNMNRAMKHFMIAAGAGDDDSLTQIRQGFLKGHATKDDFEKTLRAHKEASDEMKSEQREAAAAILEVDRN